MNERKQSERQTRMYTQKCVSVHYVLRFKITLEIS